MRRVRAFTLIELLVVMAIIALLIGIALPSMAAVQRESRNGTCMSNLRQTYTAIQSYEQTNHDVLPMCEFIPVATNNGPDGGLPNLLKGIMPPTSEAWLCPCDDHEDSVSTGTSYLYVPGLLRYTPAIQAEVMNLLMAFPPGSMTMEQLDHARVDAEARLMTNFYRNNGSKYPLLVDSEDRHKRVGTQRNGVFLDGSARVADPPPEMVAPGTGP